MADRLEQEILSRAPEVGTKLTSERQLAERFGVSRPIVRESLRSLAERGLIEIRPGRGAYIRATRPTDAAHPLDALLRRQQITGRRLVEARLMLEQEAAYRAAERAEAEDLELMEKAMERFEAARDLVERAH